MKLQSLWALAGRLLLALIFIVEGWVKLRDISGTLAYMASYGVPGFLLPAAVLTELAGGLLVSVGLWTRPAAIALAGFCLLTAFIFHRDFGAPGQMVHFLKDLAIAGGFLVLAAFGPGRFSIDVWRAGRKN